MCGEFTGYRWIPFTGYRWIPFTKASDAELLCFLWSVSDQTVEQKCRRRWFETLSRSLWHHCNLDQNVKHSQWSCSACFRSRLGALSPFIRSAWIWGTRQLLTFNTLTPGQHGRHFADIFKCMFLNENIWIPIKFHWSVFLSVWLTICSPAFVQIMAWRRSGDKPLSEPMMVSILTRICVTRPQWVKILTH